MLIIKKNWLVFKWTFSDNGSNKSFMLYTEKYNDNLNRIDWSNSGIRMRYGKNNGYLLLWLLSHGNIQESVGHSEWSTLMVQELAVEDCQKFLRNFMYCNPSRNRNRKLAPEANSKWFYRLNVGAISNSEQQSEGASASVQCSCIFGWAFSIPFSRHFLFSKQRKIGKSTKCRSGGVGDHVGKERVTKA